MTIVVAAALSSATAAAEPGLVAHYTFDEGKGTTAGDSSASGNTGKIRGAKWVRAGDGHALEFDGVTTFVDCGNSPSLDLREAMTLMAWVCPAGRQTTAEPGLLGKQFGRFLLTFHADTDLYWYVNWGDGGSYARTPLLTGRWSHVAATFDGKTLRLFVNGKLASSSPIKTPTVNAGKNFVIGSVVGEPDAKDTFFTATAPYRGHLDDVRVYNRALGPDEVRACHREEAKVDRDLMFRAECAAVEPQETVQAGDVTVSVGRRGGLQIAKADSFFVLDSRFSYPAKAIGSNTLSETAVEGEDGWKPRIRKLGDRRVRITAAGAHYGLTREVRVTSERIEIADTLVNRKDSPVGVLVHHRVVTPAPMTNTLARTASSCPLLFFSQKSADFGLVAEDDVARLQFDCGAVANRADIRHSSFALDAGRTHTFRYAVYPLAPAGDLYALVNKVRRDWKTNFTILGPFQFIDVTNRLLSDPVALQRYLLRKNLNLVAITPFLDYDPGGMDHVATRDEYKALVQAAAAKIRRAKPGIKVIGSIECDWVTIWPDRIEGGRVIADRGNAREIARVIDEAALQWKDSIKRSKSGTVAIEYYRRGGKPQYALAVYPAPGNYQEKFLLEQAAFLMDEVGLDGFYIDEFSQAWRTIRSYEGWDGVTVDIAPATGKIVGKCVDCGLAGIRSRVAIINAASGRGKIVVANTYATAAAEQALSAQRFAEVQGHVRGGMAEAGKKPGFVPHVFDGLLATPIGLGVVRQEGDTDLAATLMSATRCYLRHGALIYHYAFPDLPESGTGAGRYGPINHMFPITPVNVFEGGIVGRERTITCISGRHAWSGAHKPNVLVFDNRGRAKTGKTKIEKSADGWTVDLQIADWADIAVIEPGNDR